MMEVKSFCRTTARAFKPRLELAAYEKSLGNRVAGWWFIQGIARPEAPEIHQRSYGYIERATGQIAQCNCLVDGFA